MAKSLKILLSCFGAICAFVILFFYNNYQKQIQIDNIKHLLDIQIKILNKNLESQKFSAMSLAVLLSQNENIKNCLLQNNKEKCRQTIQNISQTLSRVGIYKNVKFHLHTPSLTSFVRSWMPLQDDNLASFSFMLNEAKNGVMGGIEVGKAGAFIRGVSQIFNQDSILGSIEVLLDFEYLSKFFADFGVDLFVMLDKNTASIYKEASNELINGYFLENKKFANLNILPFLKEINLDKIKFYTLKNHNFAIEPMRDFKGDKIGYFILYFNSNKNERNLVNLNS